MRILPGWKAIAQYQWKNGWHLSPGILLLFWVLPMGAQIPPIPSESPFSDPIAPQSQPQIPLEIESSSPDSDSVPIRPNEAICIRGFEYVGNTAFNSRELDDVIQKVFEGRETNSCLGFEVTFADILQARTAIAQLYIDRHYLGTVVYVPNEQEIEVGKDAIAIEILEGEVEEVRIEGLERLSSGYVRDRMARAISPPLNQEKVLEGLRLLQFNPLLEDVAGEISQGSGPGKTILTLQIQETADIVTLQPGIDNDRSPGVGSFRQNVAFNAANLSGLGDTLDAIFRRTEGSQEFDLNYSLPINGREGTIGGRFRLGRGQVIEPPFEPFDLASQFRTYEIFLRQPLVRNANGKSIEGFDLELTFSRQESELSILGFNAPLSPGADENGESKISVLRFSQEWYRITASESFSLRSEFNLGVGWLNATLNPDPFASDPIPDSNFLVWRGQGQWLGLLAPQTTLSVKAIAQLSDRILVSSERFGLGGRNSVRGYRQDLRLTDNGLLASVELTWPIQRFRGNWSTLYLAPFVDIGTGWNSSDDSISPNTLVGTGLGLLWKGENFEARFDWGIPLVDVEGSTRTWQESGIYFSIIYDLF
ncbi:MAG: ShlB/FhaC/HecB family hemolysin secretion/activation protein [Cyanobacteria bacterium SBLK]|nr:ShlB/FhaC/HecB family hemolysin secretion/activation protein [Cyanobacteria bacterium SBLK]